VILIRHNGKIWQNNEDIEISEKCCSTAKFYSAGCPSDADNSLALFKCFLKEGAKLFQGKRSTFKRGKPLLAFEPTAFFDNVKDETSKAGVLKELMSFVYTVTDQYGVDIALCTPDRDMYLSALSLREKECPFEDGAFWMLSQRQKIRASTLARDAKVGRLAIFLGAGVSIPSGAPSWGRLLELLAIKADLNEEDRRSLSSLDYLDQPTILEEEMGKGFKPSVADLVNDSYRYTPAHALLKTLRCPAVTTNYDALYEQAAQSCGEYIPCLPFESRRMIENNHPIHNSLLKLHGCVNYPDTIVLTRKDYMRYPDTSQALRGRLQGIFLTNEILFCGFSMTDDNVHKVIDDVRKSVYGENGHPVGNSKLGTVLTMTENKMFNRLWDQDFHIQSFGKSWSDNPSWYHDCFLDALISNYFGANRVK